jgi:hypothetical protein
VEVRWRSLFRSTSLGKRCTSYNAPPISGKRAADRCSLRNFLHRSSLFMVGKAQKSKGTRSGLYGGCSDEVPPIHFFKAEHRTQFRSRHMGFLVFSNHEKRAPGQEISKWSTVCSTFSRRRWSVVSSASLAKGGTSKKRLSPHLHKVPARINKVSPRTLQTALTYSVTTQKIAPWTKHCPQCYNYGTCLLLKSTCPDSKVNKQTCLSLSSDFQSLNTSGTHSVEDHQLST